MSPHGGDTSHAEGTLNILTGRYKSYRKVGDRGLAPLLEPSQPTLFECLRKAFDIPSYQAGPALAASLALPGCRGRLAADRARPNPAGLHRELVAWIFRPY